MLWFWKHWALHRWIIKSHQPWSPGERACCWVCGKTWTADIQHPGVLHVSQTNNKAPQP